MGFCKLLTVKSVSSLPASKVDIGCLLDDRYFYYYPLTEKAYWICWDMLKKREVLVKETENGKKALKWNESCGNKNKLTYGCLLMERYYVLNKTVKEEYLICWDMRKKCDIAINSTQVTYAMSKTSWLLDISSSENSYEAADINYNDSICMQPETNRQASVESVHPVQCGYDMLGRYRVLEWVSDQVNAQFSNVCLCYDGQEDGLVAIKIYKPVQGFVTLAAGEVDMLNEIQTRYPTDVRKMRIIQMLDSFKITNEQGAPLFCIVFEAMEGDLYKLIRKRQALPVELVKDIMRQILEGLEFLHEGFQIVHADLKLENILYLTTQSEDDVELVIKIADLGNSCWLDEPQTDVIQTIPYRSLEVLLNAGYGLPADIWSTACIGFELATGIELFNISTDQSVQEDIHLAEMISLLGPIPQQVLARGMKSHKFFNSQGQLLLIPPLQPRSLADLLQRNSGWSSTDAQNFAAFLTPMLEYDADKRATAFECLQHAWLS